MLNNFIGGGQVFLHKVRMFKQVAGSTFKLALLIGICVTVFFRLPEFKTMDTAASMTYVRAHIAMKFHEIIPSHSGNRKGGSFLDRNGSVIMHPTGGQPGPH